jgi:integrase
VRPLTHDDAADILVAVTGHWLELPVRVLLGSGLRLGELVGLDQGDLMLEAGFVRVRHSKTTVRAVPVSDDAVDALRDALRKHRALAPTSPCSSSRGPPVGAACGIASGETASRTRCRVCSRRGACRV